MTKAGSLTRTDWTMAATAALAAGGIDSVRVEPLARNLGTSKGSFYWHFANRAELLEAVLVRWEAEGTNNVITMAAGLETPRARLMAVLKKAVVGLDLEEGDVAGVEGALRAWSAQDAAVAARVRAVDERRVAYLARELEQLGHDAGAARWRAEVLYLALLGYYAASRYDSSIANVEALREMMRLAMKAV
jgi:AcrR family transcriptional regulator